MEFGLPFVVAEGPSDFGFDTRKCLDEERSGIDEGAEDFRGDASSDGVFAKPGEVGIDVTGGAKFTGRTEKFICEGGVERLLIEKAALAVSMEDAEISMRRRARHTAGASVSEGELAEIGIMFF